MIFVRIIDKNGIYLEEQFIEKIPTLEDGTPSPLYIERIIDEIMQFQIPKWNGIEWIEGMAQEEIDLLKNVVVEPTEIELLKKENLLLKAQVKANSDVSDFHEELIVELAMMLY